MTAYDKPSMSNVRVEKSTLIEILQKNRDAHRAIFDQAVEVYRERIIDHLERMIDAVKNGHKVEHRIQLVQPVDYTKEYDRALKQLELSLDDEVHLNERDFAQFVMDDWNWKEAFATNTEAYLVT